jgi:hypothetical protein
MKEDSSERAQLSDDTIDAVSKALRRAWQLGQTYWQQADSDFDDGGARSGVTQKKFETLLDETSALLAAARAIAPVSVVEPVANGEVIDGLFLQKATWTAELGYAINSNDFHYLLGKMRDAQSAADNAPQAPSAGSEAEEGYAFKCDGKLWVVTDPDVAMKWQSQGFVVTPVVAANAQSPSVLTDEFVDEVMAQAQVFASAWSLVGGPFDYGDGLEAAETEKVALRALLQANGEKS